MKIPYYNKRGDFNGATCDWDTARAVHYSKTIEPPQVIRVPEGQSFRYYWQGFEVKRDEVFLAGTEVKGKGRKPSKRQTIRTNTNGSGQRPTAEFSWDKSSKGPVLWMPRRGTYDYICRASGEHIPKGAVSYAPKNGGQVIQSTWRLSHIPDDAVKL